MKTSQKGIDLIKNFEGMSLKAYPDPGTGGKPHTIGVGHCGPEVHLGLVWTKEQCDEALKKDLEHFEKGVIRLCGTTLSQNQFDALVSFSFNVGLGNLEKSTLLKKLKLGDYVGAADQFLVWVKANGNTMSGLVKRRKAERALFLS